LDNNFERLYFLVPLQIVWGKLWYGETALPVCTT